MIGLFGLFGVAGVLAANAAGRQADRQRTYASTIVFSLLLLVSFVILALGRNTVILLALGIMVLGTGMQGMQITNQSVIYGLLPGERSRLNSAYMVSAFAGASVGSYLAGQLYAHLGWYGDCGLLAGRRSRRGPLDTRVGLAIAQAGNASEQRGRRRAIVPRSVIGSTTTPSPTCSTKRWRTAFSISPRSSSL